MVSMTDQSSSTTTIVPSSSAPEMRPHRAAEESSLSRAARNLAAAARAFRDASDAQHDAQDLALAFAIVDAALDDLGAGAELVAYGTMERSRRRRAGAPDGLPLPTARAVSWRLHGFRSRLVAARRICSELTRALSSRRRSPRRAVVEESWRG
jgi:hypothetical protein